jgi:PHD/YefM family antitoxin component YafN of YafNO toxin-antitoxin module
MSQAQGALPELVELATHDRVVLTRNDKTPVAVLLSIGEFRAIQGMLELSGDLEKLSKIYRIYDQVRAGNLEDFKEVSTSSGVSFSR